MYLNLLQDINDILYKMFGASDIVINIQVYINKKRNAKNQVDDKEILLYDEDQPIVQ